MADTDHYDLLELFDPCADTRSQLRHLAAMTEEWAGIPLALDGGPDLKVEPSYPYASIFAEPPSEGAEEAETDEDGWSLRTSFYSVWRRAEILIMEKDGRIDWGIVPQAHNLAHQIATMTATAAWGIEQEATALRLMSGMVRHHQLKSYLLCGAFIERSQRSDVLYMFRKLRPTLALTDHGAGLRGAGKSPLRILASLCLHPIGYYDGSWAGAMCPTDDVVAHLALMRADEHLLWRRANQHPAHMAAAGI